MANYDTEVRIKTTVDNSGLKKGTEEIEKSLDDAEKKAESKKIAPKWSEEDARRAEEQIDRILAKKKKLQEEPISVGVETEPRTGVYDWQTNAEQSARISREIEASMQAEAAEKAAKATEKQAAQQAKVTAQQQAERAEQEHLESIRSRALISNQNMVDLLREQESLESRIAELKKAGVTEGYQEYDQIQSRLAEIRTQINEERKGFGEAEKAARGFHNTLQKGTKKSNSLLGTMGSRLKGLALSLLMFNWISKGFNALISSVKEGFKNLAQYSSEYNTAMSDMKSGAAQLKNGLAAAFEPIITMAIPYITRLIDWLNKAIEKVGQFLAALSGRTTYTRAKQQMIDYAESIDSAAKSAKRALAPFDQLNVIAKQDTSNSGSGGELTGADAFETVEIDDGVLAAAEKVRDILKEILPIVIAIGGAFALWKISKLIDNLIDLWPIIKTLIGLIALIYGLKEAVEAFIDMFENGIDWEGIKKYIEGVAIAAVGAFILFGLPAAAIILLIGGIAALILAIKDLCENGLTAENTTLLVVGAIMTLIGVFVVFGGVAAIVVGAIMLVVAAIAAVVIWAGNGEECLESLKNQFGALGDFVKHVFAGDFEAAFDDIKEYLLYFANTTNVLTESFVNLAIAGINKLLDGLNKLFGTNWHIDDWQAPTLKSMNKKASTSSVAAGKIPKLADGAVIQGGRPFAAILGDQRVGQTNIEAPLDTLVEAMMRANKESGGSGGTYIFTAQLNSREIFREIVRQNQMYKKSTGGKSAFA